MGYMGRAGPQAEASPSAEQCGSFLLLVFKWGEGGQGEAQ